MIIWDNICFFNLKFLEEEVEYVVFLVFINNEIKELLKGYDILVGECGVFLFGG